MATPFIDFRPAQVMRNKEVYVCYYVLDPTNDKLKRMRVRCNRIKNRREQIKYATLLCVEVNRKLYDGWNPLTGEYPAAKKRVSVVEAATDYVRKKEKELRKDSARSYRPKLSFFTKWCEKSGVSEWLCKRFSSSHAASILDEYGDGGRSAYSFNSMLQFLKSMFKSFVSDGITFQNPFETFKGRRKETKRRITIPRHDRKRILNYFQKRGMKEYVTMIRLCFRYLIRPKEILMLRISDINFDTSLLRVPPDVSKNHTERIIAIGYDVMKYFQELQRFNYPSDTYIFSTDFKPGVRLYTTKNLFAVWQRQSFPVVSLLRITHWSSMEIPLAHCVRLRNGVRHRTAFRDFCDFCVTLFRRGRNFPKIFVLLRSRLRTGPTPSRCSTTTTAGTEYKR